MALLERVGEMVKPLLRPRGDRARRWRPLEMLLASLLVCLMVGVEVLLFRAYTDGRNSSNEFERASRTLTNLANVQRETLLLHTQAEKIAAGETHLEDLKLRRQLVERQVHLAAEWDVPDWRLVRIRETLHRFDSYARYLFKDIDGRVDRDVILRRLSVTSQDLERQVKSLYDLEEQRFFAQLRNELDQGASLQQALLLLGIAIIVTGVVLGFLIRRSIRSDFTKAYSSLTRLERKYRSLLERVPAIVYAADFGSNGKWHFVSPQIESILGFTPDEWAGNPLLWHDQLHPEDRERALRDEEESLTFGDRLHSEYRLLDRNGRVVWIRDEAVVVEDERGGRFLEGIMLDITETKESQRSTEESLSQLRATLESTADGILVVSSEGQIVNFNERFAEMWGLPVSLLESGDDDNALALAMTHLKDPSEFMAKVRELYANPDAESFDVIEFKDGRTVERLSKPQRIGGSTIGRVWSFRDVTERIESEKERTKLQEHLNQAQKLEAVGQLAGGVAHDFNNLLSVMINYTRFALEEVEVGTQLAGDLTEVLHAAERGATLTRQMLTFSRREVGEPKVINVNESIALMRKMLRRMIPEAIELRAELDPNVAKTKIDPSQFEQVLMNLAINARDAMPDGGTLTVSSRNGSADEIAAQGVDPTSTRYVVVEVSDTGHGIPEDLMPRIFEPFFTTKGLGQGTGLGLAVVYGIVSDAGGHVTLTSRINDGTRFSVFLPVISQEALRERKDDVVHLPVDPPRATGERIMVVEDEDPVRAVVERILIRAGYEVVAFADPRSAVEESLARPSHFDLLLADVMMPGMSGKELSEVIGIPTVFMSGYTEAALPDVGPLRATGRFIDKPFTSEGILTVVQHALNVGQVATC